MKPSYPLLSTDTFAIEFAKPLMRPTTSAADIAAGVVPPMWQDPGEWDYFKTNPQPQIKKAWSKSQPNSVLILTASPRTEMSASFKANQRTKVMRVLAGLGTEVQRTQAAVTNKVVEVLAYVAGGYIQLGAYNVDPAKIKLFQADGTTPVDKALWNVVDTAYGVVKMADVLSPAVDGMPGTVSFDAPARAYYQIEQGNNPISEWEITLRGVSAVGEPGILHLYRNRITPKGEQNSISQSEDFDGYEFQCDVLAYSDPETGHTSYGTWTPLDD